MSYLFEQYRAREIETLLSLESPNDEDENDRALEQQLVQKERGTQGSD